MNCITRMRLFFVAACIGMMLTTFTSCTKNSDTSTAVVRVVDTNGDPIVGAKVRVYCSEALCQVEEQSFSDANGESEYEFELPAILKIQASKEIATTVQLNATTSVASTYTLYGEGWVQLEDNDRVVQEVTLFGNN